MYPSLRTLLQCDVLELEDASILSSVCEPVNYIIFTINLADDSYPETP